MKKVVSITFICLLTFAAIAQQTPPFKTGDRVAFIGNSITEAGYYESYIWLYYMTHFPNRRIDIYNEGIGGDVARQMNARFEDDVMPKKPNIIALTFGMNDSGYFEFNQPDANKTANERVADSYKNFLLLQEKLKALPDIRTIIISSSPYDETMKNPKNYFPGKSKTLEKIVAFQKEDAQKNNWDFVDFYYPMKEINQREQKTNPEFTLTGPDRIHPGNGGHTVMAWLFLKAQGLAGKPVADVGLDARKEKVIQSVNADVNHLKFDKNKISFDYLAESLPFPIDTVSRNFGNDQKQTMALQVIPFIKDLNQEVLQVKNLSDKNYRLKIDGTEIGIWSGKDFENGINLAEQPNTPQYKQALAIMHLNQLRKDIESKLREYYWLQFDYFKDKNMLFQDNEKALDSVRKASVKNWFVKSKMDTYETARFPEVRKAWQNEMDIVVDKIYEINKPQTHKIEIEVLK